MKPSASLKDLMDLTIEGAPVNIAGEVAERKISNYEVKEVPLPKNIEE